LEPIALGYHPEDGGASFICCLDVWTIDALESYYRSTSDVGSLMEFLNLGIPEYRKFSRSLENASNILKSTHVISLKEAENSNKTLIVIDNDNKTVLRE